MDEVKPWFGEGLKFKCTGCGNCCTGSPGYVYLSKPDLERLANHFEMTPEKFSKKYVRLVEDQHALIDKPGTNDCIFLKDKRCTAYEGRPTQCRTFPWWPYNVREKEDWEEAGKRCEGVNHPDGEMIPVLEIEEQMMTYLDNILHQNFDL